MALANTVVVLIQVIFTWQVHVLLQYAVMTHSAAATLGILFAPVKLQQTRIAHTAYVTY